MKLLDVFTVNPFSIESIGSKIYGFGGGNITNNSAAVMPAANRAIFYPFSISRGVVVAQLWIHNGLAAAGNFDIGIYDAAGTRIVSSGSTAQVGTSTVQAVNITDTPLGPGLFYMGVSMDGTTGQVIDYVIGNVIFAQLCGMAQMASAFPLPATAVFAAVTSDFVPLVGWTTRGVV